MSTGTTPSSFGPAERVAAAPGASGFAPTVGSAAFAVGAPAPVYVTGGIPEQELVDARRRGRLGSARDLGGPVVDPEREVLQPGNEPRAGAADATWKSSSERADDVVRLAFGLRTPYSPGPQCDG